MQNNTYKKVTIFGCPGSGKSTLATILSKRLNIPVFHLDLFFWRPHWVMKEKLEMEVILKTIVAKHAWIIDGTFSWTYQQRIESADLVIYLDFPRSICFMESTKKNLFRYKKMCT